VSTNLAKYSKNINLAEYGLNLAGYSCNRAH